ncbi:hypothetical protein ACHAAC_00205 [Aeromicrobium sp. CF4.19]|uniref:hypothetical protein n=1 Tax=Aeromicrobium sp. CF4.19 TaxID=3373082 RepID=UPI003EE7BFD9
MTGTPPETLERLRSVVEDTSFARFAGLDGLRFKTWRASEGQWFEGTYVFVSDEARAAFQAEMEATMEDLPGTRIVGSPPELVEACEIVAVVRGPAGFRSAARFEA